MCDDRDYLMMSGIQHFSFCKRQWALIHIEQQWAENYRTADGRIMHDRAHDGAFREKRRDVIITRAMKVSSAELGISGECDEERKTNEQRSCDTSQRQEHRLPGTHLRRQGL